MCERYIYIYQLHIIYGSNVTIRKYRCNYPVVITDFRQKKNRYNNKNKYVV